LNQNILWKTKPSYIRYIRAIKGPGPVFLSDPALGMISCCPSNLGSGLRGSVHIRLPNLIKSIGFEKIDEMARSMNCQARGSSGEHSDVVDRIDISNIRRLGFPEYVLVQDMISVIKTTDLCQGIY
jgi:protein-arginine kinase